MNKQLKGFTLIEMLVSIAIFSLMTIAIYYFFDSGRWMYLKSEKRANMQENGRLAMEAMEREMRMISFGLPTGTEIGTQASWLPAVFNGGKSQISFRGDIDNVNSLVTQDIAAADTTVNVQWPTWVCPQNGTPILIVERGRNWLSYECSSPNTLLNTITLDGNAGHDFLAAESEIFSPVHVFYRLTPDTNADGQCDLTENYENCKIERATRLHVQPQTTVENESDWQTFATNIRWFNIRYYRKTTVLNEMTPPLSAANLPLVDMIELQIVARDRDDKVGQYQDATFVSQVLVRKRKF